MSLNETVSCVNNLPYSGAGNSRSGASAFVGREDDLKALHEQLQAGTTVAISAISGMGGIGKTELALQYARKHCREGVYRGGVCWLRAREDVGIQIISFARSLLDLTPPENLELVEKVRWCWGHWRDGAALLILDDAQNYEEIASFLPPQDSRFKVLMTTRSHFGSPVQELQLDVLSEANALELLRALAGSDRVDQQLARSKQLCEWLGHLPLGVELVGRYLFKKRDLSVEVLWQRLQEKRLEARAFKQAEPGMTASLGVAASFELSWQALEESAQQLAAVLSLFALVEIPWTLVEQCLPEVDAEELEEIRDQVLLGSNLLKRIDQGMYQLHQLLREFFASKREQRADVGDLKQTFYEVVIAEAERVEKKPERSLIQEAMVTIAHLQAAIDFLETPKQELDSSTCLFWVASLYHDQGRYAEAEPLYMRSLSIRQQLLGDNHPDVAMSLNSLAALYYSQGRYVEAEPLYLKALEIRQRQLGDDHPDVATSLNNVASLYKSQGRYVEAEPLYLKALETYQRQLGDDHPHVALSLNNVANLYKSQGRYIEAEPLHLEALEIYQRQLGDDHPDVAWSLDNMASLYKLQGRYVEAEPLYLKALEIRQRQLGDDHPDVAWVLNNLAVLYRSQERYAEAELLSLKSIPMMQKQLPADHPHIAKCLHDLAGVYDEQGRYSDAESLYLQTLSTFSTKLREDHPWRQEASNNFRSLLQKALQENRTDELSDHPMTRSLLQQLQ